MTQHTRARTRIAALLLVSFLPAPTLAGCAIKPVTEPPAPNVGVFVFRDQVRADEVSAGLMRLTGGPHATNGESVLVWNLSTLSAPVSATVAEDRSFTAELPGALTDVFRLEGDIMRTNISVDRIPTDGVAGEDGALEAPSRPIGDCLVVSDMVEAVALPATVTVFNGCTDDVRLDAIDMAAGGEGFALGAPVLPLVVAPGEALELQVTRAAGFRAGLEAVFRLSFGAPAADARALSVRLEAPYR